jgi:hypothetical protein
MKISFSEHNLSSCYQNGTCESSFERSQHQECFLYWTHGHLRLCLLPNPAKVPNFQYRTWSCSLNQKFHGYDEKIWKPRLWDLAQWPTAIIRPKSQNSNLRAPYFCGNTQFPIYLLFVSILWSKSCLCLNLMLFILFIKPWIVQWLIYMCSWTIVEINMYFNYSYLWFKLNPGQKSTAAVDRNLCPSAA